MLNFEKPQYTVKVAGKYKKPTSENVYSTIRIIPIIMVWPVDASDVADFLC